MQDRGHVLHDPAGNPERLVVVQHLLAEVAATSWMHYEVDSRFRLLVEKSPFPIIVHQHGTLIYANIAAQLLFDTGQEDYIGTSIMQFIPESWRAFIAQRVETVYRDGSTPVVREQYVRPDGTLVDVEAGAVLIDFNGVQSVLVVFRDISEQVRTERLLRESKFRLLQAQEIGRMGTWELDLRTRELWWSDSLYKLFGLVPRPDEPITLQRALDMLHPEDSAQVRSMQEQLERGECDFDFIHRICLPDSQSIIYVHVVAEVLKDSDDRPISMLGIVRDITEQHLASQRLMQSEYRLRMALRGGALGTWDWDVRSGRVIYDEQWAAILGYDLADIADHLQSWLMLIHPDDAQQVAETITAYLRGASSYFEIECRMRTREGGWKWICSRGEVVEWSPTRIPLRVAGTHQDITETREVIARLQESETYQLAMLSATNHVFLLISPEHKIIKINKLGEEISSALLGRKAMVGESVLSFFPPEERPGIVAGFQRVLAGTVEKGIRRSDIVPGRTTWISYRHAPAYDSEGRVFAIATSLIDVTNLQDMQTQLEEVSQRFALATEAAGIGVWDWDVLQDRMIWDEVMQRLYQVVPDKVPQTLAGWVACIHPEDQVAFMSEMQQALAIAPRLDMHFRIVAGEDIRYIHAAANIYRDPEDRPVRLTGINWDHTEQHLAQERLRTLNDVLEKQVALRTEELQQSNQELEHFAYSVSHDLRTPVRHLISYSGLLQRSILREQSEDAGTFLLYITQAAHKMHKQIEDLLSYSRIGRNAIRRIMVPLGRMVGDILAAMRNEYAGHLAEVEVGDLGEVYADPLLLEQALTNLLSNAFKYTQQQSAPHIVIGAYDHEQGRVVFVRDNGIGFDMKFHDRIFSLFQRLHTDNEYPGNGIGLANVQRIARRHSGRVWAEGEEGKGAAFFLYLPHLE
ncbi:MAG: hypothetical protein OHK0039_15390 [Bacteroidia bacterium]